jgi:hypothetical protein
LTEISTEQRFTEIMLTCIFFHEDTKNPFSAAMRINLHHHRQRRQQPQLQRLVKRVSIIPRSLKISEGSEKKFYIFLKINFKGVNQFKKKT